MPAPKNKPKGVIVYRPRRKVVVLAPSVLGWANLEKPDDRFDKDNPKFKLNAHLSDPAFARNVEIITDAVEARKEGFLKECTQAGYDASGVEWPNVEEWLQDKLKESKMKAISDPYVSFSCNYKKGVDKKTGREWETSVSAYDKKNTLLDLKKLKLGSGSLIQPIIDIGLFVSPKELNPLISARLKGVRILKLEQYSGGGLELGEVADEDLELLEDTDVDDLSDFIGSSFEGDDDTTDEDEAPL